MITDINKYKLINEARFKGRTAEDDAKREQNKSKRERGANFHVDEPTDDSAIKADGGLPYKSTINTDWLEMKLENKQPFFVIGHAGWGKTSVIKTVAKSYGLTVITVYLDKALPEDLGGIPLVNKTKDDVSYVDNALPKWAQYIYEHPDDDFLVFFDEMNQASPDVQNALMPILLESTIAGIYFDNVWFGAAGNYSDENASVSDLSAPLRSRFIKEGIWEEIWEDAFEHLIEKYKDKIPESVLNELLKYNICFNPRELDSMLKAIIKLKNVDKKYSQEAVLRYFSDYNKLEGDKSAETKKTAEIIFGYINDTETSDVRSKKAKKSNVNRALLSQANINTIKSYISNGGFMDGNGNWTSVTKENYADFFSLSPEEKIFVDKYL